MNMAREKGNYYLSRLTLFQSGSVDLDRHARSITGQAAATSQSMDCKGGRITLAALFDYPNRL